MTKIVGIIGLAGAGKDTFAGYLRHVLEWYGQESNTYSFAWAVREITQKVGFAIYDRERKEVPIVLADTWTDDLQGSIDSVLHEYVDYTTCTDLYAHTAKALAERGYVLPSGQLACSPRQFAQVLGTEGGRGIHEDFWVDLLTARIEQEEPDVALVPDTRFINEALKCTSLVVIRNPRVQPVNDHPSEALARKFSQPGGFEHALLHKPIHFVENVRGLDLLKMAAASVSTGLSLEVK